MAETILTRFRSGVSLLFVLFVFLVSFLCFTLNAQAAVRTWDGGGVDNNWSTAANWSADTQPTSADTVVFDATSTKAATIDAGFAGTVLGMTVSSGYTNTITQARTFTVGTSGYTQAAGTFAGATQTITINGNFALSGTAAFTATSGTMNWTGPSAGTGTWNISGTATFTHNSGTLVFNGTRPKSLDVLTSMTVNLLTLNMPSATAANRTITIASGDSLIALGDITLTDGFINTGALDARANVNQGIGFDGGTGFIDFGNNALAQTYTLSGGVGPIARFDSASDASDLVTFAVTSTVGIATTAGFSGTVPVTNPSNFTITYSSITLVAGTFSGSGQSAWNISGAVTISGGTLVSPTLVTVTGTTNTWDLNSTITTTNFTITKGSGNLILSTGDTIIVTGDLTLTNGGFFTGTIEAQDDVFPAATFDGGTGIIHMTRVSPQTLNLAAGTIMPGMTIGYSGISIVGPGTGRISFGGTLTMTDGTFTGGAGEVVLDGGATLSSPALFTAPSGLLDLEGTLTVNDAAAFDNNNSTVYAVCNAAGLSGTVILNNFAADCQASGEHIRIGSGSHVTTNGYLRIFGNGNQVTLESTTPGAAGFLEINGDDFLGNLNLIDIQVTTSPVHCFPGCTDGGGTSNIWINQAGFVISDIVKNTTEAGGTSSFTVALLGKPVSTVTVTVASSDVTEGTVSTSSLVFTTTNYATPQTVTVTGVDDALDDGGVTYSAVLGVSTSDASYTLLDPDDVTLVNADDDEDDGAVGFDLPSSFAMEDVKDTSSPAVAWFEAGDGVTADLGFVNLLDGPGGTAVNLNAVGSKIQAGCVIKLSGGEEYVIHSIEDFSLIGYNAVVTDPNLDPVSFGDTVTVSSAVSAIYCTELTGDAVQLAKKEILTRASRVSLPNVAFDQTVIYDSLNDSLWTDDNNNDFLYKVNQSTATITDTVTTGNQSIFASDYYTAFDSASNAVWVLNYSDDTMTKINAATGAYYNGTLGASTYAAGNNPVGIIFDDLNDSLWVVHDSDPQIKEYNTSGVQLNSFSTGSADSLTTIAYDPEDDAIWVGGYMMDPIYSVFHHGVVKLNASTGAYFNGTLANSSTYLPFYSEHGMVYDTVRNALWVIDSASSGTAAVAKIDNSTVSLVAAYQLGGEASFTIYWDQVRDVLLIPDDLSQLVTEIDPDTGEILHKYTVGYQPYDAAVDSQGDIWLVEAWDENLSEMIVRGTPYNQYYSVVTTASSQVDASTWDSITSLALTDNDDGQDLFYSVSFDDRHTFHVFTGGAWRPIASDLASVHGGTDGVWYYRDNASTWTAASTSASTRAISQAVSGNSNNQMTTAILTGLSSSDWALSGGFQTGVTTGLDFGIAMKTADPRDPPSVDEALFTFSLASSGSSGSGGVSFVSGGSININAGADCAAEPSVTLNFTASGASSMMVSALSDFADGVWESFVDSKPFSLTPPDGVKTVYVKFKSSSGNVTGAFMDAITLDEAMKCVSPVVIPPPPGPVVDPVTPPVVTPPVEVPPTEEPPVDEPPVDEVPPTPVTEPSIDAFVTAQIAGDSYYIMPTGELRPIPDAATSASYVGLCSSFTSVPDDTLTGPIGSPLFPKAGTTLVKFADDSRVYAIIDDGAVSHNAVLRWVIDEATAVINFGTEWSDYILTLSPDADFVYTLGPDITDLDPSFDRSHFVRRALLNKTVTYDAYIINPDGTQRFTSSWWVRVTQSVDGTSVYGFEDKGSDQDFNDVVLDVDARSCLEAKLSVRPLEASWHHQIGLLVYYEDQLQTNMILWPDSHEAVGQEMTIDLSSLRVK